jgi:hypothetical protein
MQFNLPGIGRALAIENAYVRRAQIKEKSCISEDHIRSPSHQYREVLGASGAAAFDEAASVYAASST